MKTTKKIIVRKSFKSLADQQNITLVDFLAQSSGLSKSLLKKLLLAGGVWLRPARGNKLKRVRRSSRELCSGDYIEMYYDPEILDKKIDTRSCFPLYEDKNYGVWFKAAGVLSQGTKFGDHCSIMRIIEQERGPKGEVYLVHRLDREVSGIMIFAYTQEAAAAFSKLLQQQKIEKKYLALVMNFIPKKDQGTLIDIPLDGASASTEYWVKDNIEVVPNNEKENVSENEIKNEKELQKEKVQLSLVEVRISTGRLHQIRRHLDLVGHPILGDYKYGPKMAYQTQKLITNYLQSLFKSLLPLSSGATINAAATESSGLLGKNPDTTLTKLLGLLPGLTEEADLALYLTAISLQFIDPFNKKNKSFNLRDYLSLILK